MLFCACDSACWPFVCVMVVGEGCFGWCCFQYCVAVVFVSRRVPGVVACSGVALLVWACSCVGWLVPGVVGACVGWLACVGVAAWFCVGVLFSGVAAWLGVGESVWWFRMLMRVLASFLSFWFCFLVLFCLVNNGLSWVLVCWLACLWCVSWLFVVCVFCFLFVGCGRAGVFVGGVGWLVGWVCLVGSAREG